MKQLLIVSFLVFLSGCGSASKTYHTVKAVKPIYHHGYYKDSSWHRKLQVGRIRVRWFEKQGVKSVRMRG